MKADGQPVDEDFDDLHPDTEKELDRRWEAAKRRNDSEAMADVINTRNRLLWYMNTFFRKRERGAKA